MKYGLYLLTTRFMIIFISMYWCEYTKISFATSFHLCSNLYKWTPAYNFVVAFFNSYRYFLSLIQSKINAHYIAFNFTSAILLSSFRSLFRNYNKARRNILLHYLPEARLISAFLFSSVLTYFSGPFLKINQSNGNDGTSTKKIPLIFSTLSAENKKHIYR